MIKHINIKIVGSLLLLIIFATTSNGYNQIINFNLKSGENIVLEAVGVDTDLDFNVAGSGNGNYLMAGDQGPFVVDRNSFTDEIVIFRVTVPDYVDLNVEVSKTVDLTLVCEGEVCPDPLPQIPYQLGWAYWNNGSDPSGPDPSVSELINSSTEILTATGTPMLFSVATFPAKKRSIGSGPPVPPTPDSGSYVTSATTSAYILVYGGIQQIPQNIQAGTYEAIINISVNVGGM